LDFLIYREFDCSSYYSISYIKTCSTFNQFDIYVGEGNSAASEWGLTGGNREGLVTIYQIIGRE